MNDLDDLNKFGALFAGRTDAYGVSEGGVRRGSVTPNLFRRHLLGNQGIGIFPMRPDDTVRFCAIDLDEPNFELAKALARDLPGQAWIERSRSGNAHVWVFFNDDCPAWVARGMLRDACEGRGRLDVEVFPKQERLLPGMVGNYINLPWYGTDRPVVEPTRVLEPGIFEAATFHGWVNDAAATRVDPADWTRRAQSMGMAPSSDRDRTTDFGELGALHECAVHILANRETNPIQPGHRQAVIFHVAKMLCNWEQIDDAEALDLVRDLNDDAVEPLSEAELLSAFRNASSGRYTYAGCDDPLMAPYVRDDCPFLS